MNKEPEIKTEQTFVKEKKSWHKPKLMSGKSINQLPGGTSADNYRS
jgi:hypothetical protein